MPPPTRGSAALEDGLGRKPGEPNRSSGLYGGDLARVVRSPVVRAPRRTASGHLAVSGKARSEDTFGRDFTKVDFNFGEQGPRDKVPSVAASAAPHWLAGQPLSGILELETLDGLSANRPLPERPIG